MNRELAAEFLALAERLHDLALRIEAKANEEDESVQAVTGTGVEQVSGMSNWNGEALSPVFMTPKKLYGAGV